VAPDARPLADLMRRSSLGLILTAAGQAPRLYSKAYTRELEAHSPFRFAVLARERKRLERQRATFLGLLGKTAAG
jgi:hypothetical protein